MEPIVNSSTLTKADLDFITKWNTRKPFFIVKRVILLAFGIFLIYESSILLRYALQGYITLTTVAAMIFGYGMAIVCLLSAVFRRVWDVKKALKDAAFQGARHVSFTEEHMHYHVEADGQKNDLEFTYDRVTECYAQPDTVYIFVQFRKKSFLCFCLHDDGYSAGSRELLLQLLKEKQIQPKN